MTKFAVPEMSCGHCTTAIKKEIGLVDQTAQVDCDLTGRIVSVESSVDTGALIAAIKEAGYEATPV